VNEDEWQHTHLSDLADRIDRDGWHWEKRAIAGRPKLVLVTPDGQLWQLRMNLKGTAIKQLHESR
jgi:hypothetical protein